MSQTALVVVALDVSALSYPYRGPQEPRSGRRTDDERDQIQRAFDPGPKDLVRVDSRRAQRRLQLVSLRATYWVVASSAVSSAAGSASSLSSGMD